MYICRCIYVEVYIYIIPIGNIMYTCVHTCSVHTYSARTVHVY